MRYAIVKGGVVTNTILLDDPQGWPLADGQALVQTDIAGIGWAYDGEAFTPPVSVPAPARLQRGAFRLLFTFEERQRETLFGMQARIIVAAGWPQAPSDPEDTEAEAAYQAALVSFGTAAAYLTMRADFEQADQIDFGDPEMVAALDASLIFYTAAGIIESHRPAEIAGALGVSLPSPD